MKLIIALDNPRTLKETLDSTTGNPSVAGYKVGCLVALKFGLSASRDLVRQFMRDDQLLIYDHQKAGNDIPHISAQLAKMVRGYDKFILFPIAGDIPVLEEVHKVGIPLIVGFHLSHLQYSPNGGSIILKAIELGIRDFVIPWQYKDRYAKSFTYLDGSINKYYVGIGTQTSMPDIIPQHDYLIVGRAYKQFLGSQSDR